MPKFLDSFTSFFKDVNRVKRPFDEQEEGIVGEQISQLTLDKDDDELLELKKKWERKWEESQVKKDIEQKQQENERYWLGDHYTPAQRKTGIRELVDNVVFGALEDALPVYTKQTAEPLVSTQETPEAKAFAKKVKTRIAEVADVIRLRLKMRKAIRYWAIYFLGAVKFGWSMEKNEIAVQAIRPQLLILDPDAMTDECEYEGEYLGHYRTDSAEDLMARFPAKSEFIKNLVGVNLGTRLRYVEWWTNDYLFWTLKDEVLGKAKNPHWNYDQEEDQQVTDEAGQPVLSEDGSPAVEKVLTAQGVNHFSNRKIPFGFLSVFNLGKSPYDDTNLIDQVIPLQDKINKRTRQIDKNADGTNGGSVVSGDHFSKEQAAGVGDALRKGLTVFVPKGDVSRAYKRDVAPPLPSFVYEDLQDSRAEARGIFGTTGLSAQGIQEEKTVRGKIIVGSKDVDRASPIVDQVEQLYDYVFNWFVQLMMVYYDEPRAVSRSQGTEMLVSSEFVYPLVVSVKEGSLIPKDPLTQRNEAIDLWTAGAIDPIEFFKRLDFPDPVKAARDLFLWKTNPLALFPELASQIPGVVPPGSPGSAPPEAKAEAPPSLLEEVPIT